MNGEWPDAPDGATYLVQSVHQARRVALDQLDAEGLRVLIAQDVDVDVVMPYAISLLEDDPLAEGDYYAGDLLEAVLAKDRSYWDVHVEQRVQIHDVLARLRHRSDWADVVDEELAELISAFVD